MKHKYVNLCGTELQLKGDVYWRDAGVWGVKFKEKNGKLYAVCPDIPHLHDKLMEPITEEEWRKGNKGYLYEKKKRSI